MSTDKKILANHQVSITEFKKNTTKVINAASDEVVVVLRFDEPEFYMIPAKKYERIISLIDKLETDLANVNKLVDNYDNTRSTLIEKDSE